MNWEGYIFHAPTALEIYTTVRRPLLPEGYVMTAGRYTPLHLNKHTMLNRVLLYRNPLNQTLPNQIKEFAQLHYAKPESAQTGIQNVINRNLLSSYENLLSHWYLDVQCAMF